MTGLVENVIMDVSQDGKATLVMIVSMSVVNQDQNFINYLKHEKLQIVFISIYFQTKKNIYLDTACHFKK